MNNIFPVERQSLSHRGHVEVGQKCQLKCAHCYKNGEPEKEMYSLENINKIVKEIEKCGAKKMTFTGGEFFLHPNWEQIIENTSVKSIYILTNGVSLNEEIIKSLLTFKLKKLKNKQFVSVGLGVSLDGLEGNRLIRGIHGQDIIEKIKLLRDTGILVTVNTTVSNKTIASELDELYDILKTLEIHRWQIAVAKPVGRFENQNSDYYIDELKKAYKKLVEKHMNSFPDVPFRLEIEYILRHDILFNNKWKSYSFDNHPCSYEFGSTIIENGSQVYFCPVLKIPPFGDILNQPLEEIYKNPDFKEFSSIKISDIQCGDCKYRKLQAGGCRASALAISDSIYAADQLCCALSPFLEHEIIPLLPDGVKDNFELIIGTNKHE